MALPDLDSSVGHSFGLEVDGVVIKQITEVSGLKIDQDVVEFKQDPNSGRFVVKKLPGRPKAGEVTLTRGLAPDSSFEDWIRDSRFGKVPDACKGGAIIVFDYEGAAIKRYRLINARLKTLGRGTRKAGDTNILTEKLILTHEGCEATAVRLGEGPRAAGHRRRGPDNDEEFPAVGGWMRMTRGGLMATSSEGAAHRAPSVAMRPTQRLTRGLFATAVGLVLGIGLLQYVLSDHTDRYFAWTIRVPLTAAFLGALYLGSGFGELLAARTRTWAEARLAVPSVFIFAGLTTIVTFLHLDQFHFGPSHPPMAQAIAWIWVVVYLAFPTVSAIVLVRQGRLGGIDPPRRDRLPTWFRAVLVVEGAIMLGIGGALLLAPALTRGLWPWPLTELTAQAIGAWGVGVGFGNVHAAAEDDWQRIRAGIPALFGIGLLTLIALARFSATVAWERAASWWLAGFLFCLLLTGAYGAWRGWLRRNGLARPLPSAG